MLKKLLIIVALLGIGAGSYGLARAFFSAQAAGPQGTATFKAGSININLAQHEGYNSVPFSMENWMPGQTQDVVFDVVNSSTVPVTLSGVVNGTWGGSLGDQKVHVTAADYWDGLTWAPMAADIHGTFTYADKNNSSVLRQVDANGGIATMRMTASFDSDAGNDFQGQTYTANILVTAEQVH